MLLAIMLMMAFMVVAATVAAPRVVQQIKRDREEEMIHRGTEYARAIKKFYKKNGRYPASLDDLDKRQVRYLRRRYEDPLTKEGKWKLLMYGDIQALLNGIPGGAGAAASDGGTLTAGGAVVPGVPSPTPGTFSFGQQRQTAPQVSPVSSGFPTNSDQGYSPEAATNNFGTINAPVDGQGNATANNQLANTNNNQQGGSGVGQNAGGSNPTIGGGAVVGVASLSKCHSGMHYESLRGGYLQ